MCGDYTTKAYHSYYKLSREGVKYEYGREFRKKVFLLEFIRGFGSIGSAFGGTNA